jgi:intracellular septation protein
MEAAPSRTRTWVRAGVDFAAPFAFVIAILLTGDVVAATPVLVIASIVALAVGLIVERRVAPLPLIAGGAAVLFGGLTMASGDDDWIKMKPTIVNLAFAAGLVVGVLLRKNPLKALLGSAVKMPDVAWKILTWRYVAFFLLIATANEAVWRGLEAVAADGEVFGRDPDRVYALWRFPGLSLLAVAFTLTQLPLMMHQSKQVLPEDPTQ